MVLHQVDSIGLEPLERFIELLGGGLFRPAVDLRHQENFLPIAVAQRLAHPELAAAVMVIPRVVHEGDAVADRLADDPDRLLFIGIADVISAEPSSPVRPRVR